MLFVNLDSRFVVTSDDEILPIEHMFDSDGEDCGPEDAVSVVAGSDAWGWLSFELGDVFEDVH